jgi:hypothetical protein
VAVVGVTAVAGANMAGGGDPFTPAVAKGPLPRLALAAVAGAVAVSFHAALETHHGRLADWM